MQFSVIESPHAKWELIELVIFYERIQPKLGDRIILEYENVLDILRQSPRNYFNITTSIRRILFQKFPCAVFYTIHQNTVEILSVKYMTINPSKFPK
jgi:hypothetical protein